MRKWIRIMTQNAPAILDGNDHHPQCKYNFSNHRVESIHFTLCKKRSCNFFFFNFTLLKIERTSPTTQALGKIKKCAQGAEKLKEKKESSTVVFLSSFHK